ncbi:MAG TPA: Bax inhibitor-1/YccA family protein [Acidobacteriaceae bacterium]|nr:Bax inhibitor-1/YccA family protein [Acidobacteriaceae bacterium]
MPQIMKSSNPALNGRVFQGHPFALEERMSLDGTVNKTGILLLCSVATAAFAWHTFMQTRNVAELSAMLWIGLIGGLIFAMVTIFKQTWAPVTAPVYALLEGLVLGSLSAVLELRFPGIAMQAVGMTFGVLFVMLLLYRSHIIPVTQKLRMGIVAATGAIMLFYIAEMILGFFGVHFGLINGSGPIGIGFSVVVVAIAAFNLILDFDFIERGVRAGAPKYMEWYGAFGLMVTLVWLYLEIIRLLAKLRD